jgi:hypothetical protein
VIAADVIDFREAEAIAAEDSAERWAQVGDADARDGFLATAARAYVEAARLWTVAAERWAAAGRDADMREAARQGAVCANAAAAALWGSQADSF